MAYLSLGNYGVSSSPPVVRQISVDDLQAALRAGWDDFLAVPTHAIFLVIIYPIIGLMLARVTMGDDLFPIAYPVAAGFALLGPFAALGLYELSRRREQGLDLAWSHALDVFRSPSFGSIVALGAVQMLIFIVWLAAAHGLYAGLFGEDRPHSITELVKVALTTQSGWALIVLGNGVGLVFAVVAMTLSVVSFPLLLDRPVGAATAVMTSIRAVQLNPVPMAVWGLIVAVAMFVGSVPFFIGLAIVLPVLGHATWHLYRAVGEPAAGRGV